MSRPYVEMTLATMRQFGADDRRATGPRFEVAPTGYSAAEISIEPDASSASYFFAAAACLGGTVRIAGLPESSLQGDVAFLDVLEQDGGGNPSGSRLRRGARRMAALHGIDVDLHEIPDMTPTLAVVAAFADTPTRISGVGFIRHHESDRIGGVVTELRRCGIDAVEEPDGLLVRPGPIHGATIDSFDDHRVAMAFSILGLATAGHRDLWRGVRREDLPGLLRDLGATSYLAPTSRIFLG